MADQPGFDIILKLQIRAFSKVYTTEGRVIQDCSAIILISEP